MAEQESMRLSVLDETGTSLCVASDDGHALYGRLARALDSGRRTVLSFRGVNTLTPAFLSAAIGQLYGRFRKNTYIRCFLLKISRLTTGRCSTGQSTRQCCITGTKLPSRRLFERLRTIDLGETSN